MRKGKQKTSKVVEATGSEKKKSSKSAIEAAVNEGVKLQVIFLFSLHRAAAYRPYWHWPTESRIGQADQA